MKPTIEIDFRGPQGNIFYVLFEARTAVERSAWAGDIPWEQRERRINNAQIVVVEMQQRVQQAKGYKEALNIIEEYVTIKSKGGLPMK